MDNNEKDVDIKNENINEENKNINETETETNIKEESSEENFSIKNFFAKHKTSIKYISFGIVIFILIILFLIIFLGDKLADANLKNIKTLENIFKEDIGVVTLDPGHGGEVPISAPDLQEKEKDDVLKLCLLIEKELKDRNVKVIMTRKDDSSVELEERAEIANKNNSDLFLSIHRNISDVGDHINGIEVWLAYDKGEISDIYGTNLHDALLASHTQGDRGIRYGSMTNPKENYKVNGLTTMPSALIELGFMTNDIDNELYDTYMGEYAVNLADAVVKTLTYMNENK